MTVANTSIDAKTSIGSDECRAVYEQAATTQDGLSFEEYCSTAQQFFEHVKASGIPVMILTNNNKHNVQKGMETMGLTNYSMHIISIHELRQSNPDATKANELRKHCVQHNLDTCVFVDDSSEECCLMRASFPVNCEEKEGSVPRVVTIEIPQPARNTREKGGLFNYPGVVAEIRVALVVD